MNRINQLILSSLLSLTSYTAHATFLPPEDTHFEAETHFYDVYLADSANENSVNLYGVIEYTNPCRASIDYKKEKNLSQDSLGYNIYGYVNNNICNTVMQPYKRKILIDTFNKSVLDKVDHIKINGEKINI